MRREGYREEDCDVGWGVRWWVEEGWFEVYPKWGG